MKPRDLKASDIVALPEREREAWIHGAISLTAHAFSEHNSDEATCVIGWYFGGNGAVVIEALLTRYSDQNASSVVIAAAHNACS